jgi:uncharacterized protein (TIGR02246 family)
VKQLVAILTVGILIPAFQMRAAESQPQQDAREAIQALNKSFSAAVAQGDAVAVAALYSKDAMAFPPEAGVVRGRDEIRSLWKAVLDGGVKGVVLKTLTVDQSGDLASEVGTATLMGAEGKEVETVKYLVVWKREGNMWKLHRDIWNSMQPPATK